MRPSCGALVLDEVIEPDDANRQSIPRRCDRIADHCDALDAVDPARHVYAQGRVAEERHLVWPVPPDRFDDRRRGAVTRELPRGA